MQAGGLYHEPAVIAAAAAAQIVTLFQSNIRHLTSLITISCRPDRLVKCLSQPFNIKSIAGVITLI